MKIRTLLFASLLLGMTLASCEKEKPLEPLKTTGAWVLNSGTWGTDNSNLGLYNPETKAFTADVFSSVNGIPMGQTGNDMIAYGGKMYIAVSDSQVIFVTDKNGKMIDTVEMTDGEALLSPRRFTKYDGKVYVSYYGGYVGQIDTASFDVKTVKVGAFPEDIEEVNGKIYVANSRQDKTISVINPASMQIEKNVEVNLNPGEMVKDSKGNLYIASWGNYGDVAGKFQQYNCSTGKLTDIEGLVPNANALDITPKGVIIAVQTVYDANWTAVASLLQYDTNTGKAGSSFITDGTEVQNPYSVSIDPVSGNIYVGTSDYMNNGDVFVFDAAGKKLDSFGTQGINPVKVCFTTNR